MIPTKMRPHVSEVSSRTSTVHKQNAAKKMPLWARSKDYFESGLGSSLLLLLIGEQLVNSDAQRFSQLAKRAGSWLRFRSFDVADCLVLDAHYSRKFALGHPLLISVVSNLVHEFLFSVSPEIKGEMYTKYSKISGKLPPFFSITVEIPTILLYNVSNL